MGKAKTIKDYLEEVAQEDQRARMAAVFQWIGENFPQLEGQIKWNQPMFVYKNTFIIGFSSAKHHMSFTPEEYTMTLFMDDIEKASYEHTKGIAKIKWSDAVDYDLLKRIIEFNIADKEGCKTFFRKQ